MQPTYLVIGVQKSGTTSMIDYFNQHPEIYMHPEEIHFFNSTKFKKKKLSTYERYLNKKNIKNKKIIGEKTPAYSFIPKTIKNIYNSYPNIKLVMILREPIKRAFSQYIMVCEKLKITPSNEHFYETIKSIEHIKLKNISSIKNYYYLQRGYYYLQIKNIYKYFSKENLYIGIFEKIVKNKEYEYNKIFNFIGAEENNKINYSNITRKNEYKFELSFENKKYLYDLYKHHNKKLYKLLGYKIKEWEKYYKTEELI